VIYRAVNASISRTAQVKFSSERFTGNKLKRTYRLSCGDKDVYTGIETCIGVNLYRSYHDGVCGTYSTLYQSNSATCGYVTPPPPSGCIPGFEYVNDSCAYCTNTFNNCCYQGRPAYCQTFANCSRICNCEQCL
jgi:hypothetical protein